MVFAKRPILPNKLQIESNSPENELPTVRFSHQNAPKIDHLRDIRTILALICDRASHSCGIHAYRWTCLIAEC